MVRWLSVLSLSITVLGATAWASESPLYKVGNRLHSETGNDAYLNQIQPLLNARCVSCHGCYEAPCQLNLESYEGLRRGYHPAPIFSPSRPGYAKPTRLMDAKSLQEWREKGFQSVVDSTGSEPEADGWGAKHSVMYTLVSQGAKQNAAGFALAPLAAQQERIGSGNPQCVSSGPQWNEVFLKNGNTWGVQYVGNFLKSNPQAGMPFGLTRMGDEQEKRLLDWMEQGALGPDKAAAFRLEAPSRPEVVARWEAFLNGQGAKAELTARYLYEHTFTAHYHFEENPGEFFEIVRSRTRDGAVDQIVTELPYDHPGTLPFYYRLKKITRAIAAKNHFVWHLNDARLAHLKDLFLNAPEWRNRQVSHPLWGSANPFANFAEIPARVRSTFMMENSRIIVAGMTQGSVCIGSTATYAIADHFWAWFLRPESDPSVQIPGLGLEDIDTLQTAPLPWTPTTSFERFTVKKIDQLVGTGPKVIKQIAEYAYKILNIDPDKTIRTNVEEIILRLRESKITGEEIVGAVRHFFRTTKANQQYQQAFERSLRKMLKAKHFDYLRVLDLWDGTGDSSYPNGNPNAWLNITRHGKSATVQYGDEGGKPQNIWVMSYSNFERLYYNLVVSYKEWGSILHKGATWRHMSYVRLEGEDLAISFLPEEQRAEVRARFTRGLGAILQATNFPLWANQGFNEKSHWLPWTAWDLPPRPSPYRMRTADESIHYLVEAVRARLTGVEHGTRGEVSADRKDLEAKLDRLMERSEVKTGDKFAQFLPSVSYLVVNRPGAEPWVFSFLADRGYLAHNIMLAESSNRDPKQDQFSWYRGIVGNYPNAFLSVDEARAGELLADLENLSSAEAGKAFLVKWGVSRNSAGFWAFFDWLHQFKAQASPGVNPVEQGIADLSQYELF